MSDKVHAARIVLLILSLTVGSARAGECDGFDPNWLTNMTSVEDYRKGKALEDKGCRKPFIAKEATDQAAAEFAEIKAEILKDNPNLTDAQKKTLDEKLAAAQKAYVASLEQELGDYYASLYFLSPFWAYTMAAEEDGHRFAFTGGDADITGTLADWELLFSFLFPTFFLLAGG